MQRAWGTGARGSYRDSHCARPGQCQLEGLVSCQLSLPLWVKYQQHSRREVWCQYLIQEAGVVGRGGGRAEVQHSTSQARVGLQGASGPYGGGEIQTGKELAGGRLRGEPPASFAEVQGQVLSLRELEWEQSIGTLGR